MHFRRIHDADRGAVADFLDARTMVLRWLVAFIRHQDVLPEEESESWSNWCGIEEGRKSPACVIAHYFPLGTTFLAAADGVELGALEALFEEELLPERIVGDIDGMERLRAALPGLFERASRESAIDVLAYEGTDEVPAGFRPARREDRSILEEYGRLLAVEAGSDAAFDFESLIEHELVFVVEREGRVAGCVRSNLSDGRYVHAGGLYVHPSHRGKGVGRALAAGVGAWVRSRARATAVLDVNRENVRALRAYEGAGYRKVGEGLELRLGEEAWA